MMTLPKTAQETSHYLPHSGSMCLIDEVISLNESHIIAHTASHRNEDNPLRFEGKLPSVSAIEYAAQTMALHLALRKSDNTHSKTQGYLAAVQHCVIHQTHLDSITNSLRIECKQIHWDAQGGALYEFAITAALQKVISGSVLIMFNRHDREAV